MANIVWEDQERPSRTIAMETADHGEVTLEANPDALLVAALPLAQWHGEKRVSVEGTICCRLRDGLGAAMELFGTWYERCHAVSIEPTHGFAPSIARSEPRAGLFLSGGIDALSALRVNRIDYAAGHASSVRDCILLFGLNTYDMDEDGVRPERLAAFAEHASRLSSLCGHVDATLIQVETNIRSLYPDYESWSSVGFGAGMLSTALCLSARIDRLQIASAGLGMQQEPRGSHAWLDHHYSTEAVAVRHAQVAVSRFDKTRIVADWPEGLSVLRSCYYRTIPPEGRINCGECDKCVRTMLALLALGKLDQAPTFPFDDVTPAMVEALRIGGDNDRLYLAQCLEPLNACGRSDLTRAIEHKLTAYDRRVARRTGIDRLKRLAGLS